MNSLSKTYTERHYKAVNDTQTDFIVTPPEIVNSLFCACVCLEEKGNKTCLYSDVSDRSVTLIQATRGSELFVIHIFDCLISKRVCVCVCVCFVCG